MFTIAVATDEHNNIGHQGKIPWKCSEDLRHFKRLTSENVVIMGRKTYESIGKPLPDRTNIVISKSGQIAGPSSLILVDSPLAAVRHCVKHEKGKKWFVIGGSEIYKWFLDNGLISDMYMTNICCLNPIANCDTKFPVVYTDDLKILDVVKLSEHATCTHYAFTNVEESNCMQLMREILDYGHAKPDRTGFGTKSLFGRQLRFDLRNNTFPLMTTRRMFLRGIFAELMMFIRGQTNNQVLEDQKISIWRGNTTREFLDARKLTHMPVGDMGASYGFLFRHFGAKYNTCLDDYTGQGVDQLANVIKTLKTNPNDRRMIISLWNPVDLDNCPLPPCLYNYQFYVHNNKLSCMMTQRSSDFVVAGGWNIATGALLTYLIAAVCNLEPNELIWNLGDVHVYNNLQAQAAVQLTRTPRLYPKIYINKKENIEDFEFSDLELLCYDPHPTIEMVMNA